jgi:hypothetical protein
MRKRKQGSAGIKENSSGGKGQGDGATYRPYLSVQDFPSIGQVNRVLGWKTERHHELFSNLELWYFYLLDWSIIVSDIQEQFPLWPVEETLAIANEAGIRHPHDKQSQPVVLTTDFLITIKRGNGLIKQARTVKPAAHLEKRRTIEKFEIERRYYQARDIDFGIVTENEINTVFAKNIEWVHKHRNIFSLSLFSNQIIKQISRTLTKLTLERDEPFRDIALSCDDHLGLEPGSSLSIARHLIASRQWQVDMTVPILPTEKLTLTKVTLTE